MLPGDASAALCDNSAESDEHGLHEADATPFQFRFESGASWEMCWHIDPQAGLVISRVSFGAPNEHSRQLLDSASIGQILFKYDEDTTASHLLSETGLGGVQFSPANHDDCIDGELLAGIDDQQLCKRFRDLNHLTKVRNTESIRRHEISLHAHSNIGSHQFEQVWRFTEDGELTPTLLFSGRINRYTNNARYGVQLGSAEQYAASALILVNWRLDFNIDGTANNDTVDEIEFLPFEGDKRTIAVTALTTEVARSVNSENFRGWRISDADVSSGEAGGSAATTRVGYYLDPQGSGYRYVSDALPWTASDFFVTERNNCEEISSSNNHLNTSCATGLEEYVNDAPLSNADVVVWFSQSRHFSPRQEDYPAISTREIGFKLIPFDWSDSSPFESLAVDNTTASSSDGVR